MVQRGHDATRPSHRIDCVNCMMMIITSDQSNLTQGRVAAAHGRFSRICQVAPICTSYTQSTKMVAMATPLSICGLPSNMIPWAHRSPQPKRHLDRFSRFCTAHRRVSLYFAIGLLFPLKIVPSHGGSGTPSNTWFPGPTRVRNPNGISIGSAVFAGLTSVTDRPTDHATRSITIGRIYVRSTAMRPNNTHANVYGAVLVTKSIARVHAVHLMNAD